MRVLLTGAIAGFASGCALLSLADYVAIVMRSTEPSLGAGGAALGVLYFGTSAGICWAATLRG